MPVQISTFDSTRFDFREIALRYLRSELSVDIANLEDAHQIFSGNPSAEFLRQRFYDLFRTDSFQDCYRAFSTWLMNNELRGYSIIQKTPTIRVQFPGELSVSFHTDEWYGHDARAITVWVPLTRLGPSNTLQICFSEDDNRALEKLFQADRFTLDRINEAVQQKARPVLIDYGQNVIFSATDHHGTTHSNENFTRISFDFRFVKTTEELGTKPPSNYIRFDGRRWRPLIVTPQSLRLIMLTNYLEPISTKNQALFINSFCSANSHTIVGAESEIITLEYMPVLEYYLTASLDHYDGVVVFSKHFIRNQDYVSSIGDSLERSNKVLVIAEEDLILSKKEELTSLFVTPRKDIGT